MALLCDANANVAAGRGGGYRNRHSTSSWSWRTSSSSSTTTPMMENFGWFFFGGGRREERPYSSSSSFQDDRDVLQHQQELHNDSFGRFLAEAKRGGVVSSSSNGRPPWSNNRSSTLGGSSSSDRATSPTTYALRRGGDSTLTTTTITSPRQRRQRRNIRQQQQQDMSEADFLLGRFKEEGEHGLAEDCDDALLLMLANRKTTTTLTKEPRQKAETTKDNKVKTKKIKIRDEHRPLTFIETMVCGAVSRSVAQTTMHPANTMKTLLQNGGTTIAQVLSRNPRLLLQGAGANFLLSIPHGAINFAILEYIRHGLSNVLHQKGPAIDFCSSCIATITCSVVSTPQMMICDNIMANNYPNLMAAVRGLAAQRGIAGFYTGWWPGLVGKIPSYALTWTFFQQFKRLRQQYWHREATDMENSAMGGLASALSVCLMIPVDTIKTRLVTQNIGARGTARLYDGIVDCAVKTFQNEGLGAFYKGLPPRLVSVVPMIGIQFGVYEFMKRVMLQRQIEARALAAAEEEQRREQQKHAEDELAVEGSDVP
jgi:hypothetical protein